jgi:chromosome segregation ATPase
VSGKIKAGKLADGAEATVLGRVVMLPAEEPAPALDAADLIARFQLETEAALGEMRREMHRLVTEQSWTVASLRDEWEQTRGEVGGLRRTVDAALHDMRAGVTEAITAAKSASSSAGKAETAAAVFEKLKASQPDFHRMVQEQNRVIGDVRTRFEHLESRLSGYAKRLDELDAVAVDYADTKGEVRGLDLVVKDLNTEARQRRKIGGISS